MLTTNEKIFDRYIRHQTYILRYAGGLRNAMLPKLAETEGDLYSTIVKYLTELEGKRILYTTKDIMWEKSLRKAIEELRNPVWGEISNEMVSQFKDLAINEAATGAAIIESSVPVVIGLTLPPAQQLVSIVNSQPFEGRTLKQWLGRTKQADIERILASVKIGITQGLTPTQVARSIVGTKEFKYTDAVARRAFNDVESLALTITNGIQAQAKQALYDANADIIDREMYSATLDARTTIECASFDGKIFKRGEGPIPPLHFRCRSLRIPFISYESLRNRPFNSSTEKELLREYAKKVNIPVVSQRSALPRGFKTRFDKFAQARKRELIGQIPARTTYSQWLKKQTKEFQDEVLGVTRAEMFRSGKVKLDKFIARDGDVLTLDQLRQRGLDIPDI